MFCEDCGAALPENANVKFCPDCGAPRAIIAQKPQQIQQIQPVWQPPPVSKPAGSKKISGALIALLVAVPVLVLVSGGLLIYFLAFRGGPDTIRLPAILPDVSYTYQSKKPEAVIEFTTVDEVFPSNYRSLESLAVFTGYCDYGTLDVLIEVEVPGFTQSYKQKITLGRQVTKLRILPPLVTGNIGLNSEKMAQLVYSVTDTESGKLLVQESKTIKLYSRYDIVWGDETNIDAYTDNILAWMTIDVPEIVELKRDAIEYLSDITGGRLEMLVGYQDLGIFDNIYVNTWVQAVAIQGAISDIAKVRYNNSLFSMDAQQRVLLPADVLRTRSGICVETSLLMAAALQSMGMHCMLLFPPGHAQVALEAWPGTGDYFLIETTILPMAADEDTWNRAVMLMDKDEWLGYITGEGSYTLGLCYIVDCDLAVKLGIRAMSN